MKPSETGTHGDPLQKLTVFTQSLKRSNRFIHSHSGTSLSVLAQDANEEK